MLSVLIVGILSGGLATYGVPHFIKGMTGEKQPTPFGKPSTASQNVIWGWLNLAIATILWHLAPMAKHPRAAFLAVTVGVLFVGLGLANNWNKKTKA